VSRGDGDCARGPEKALLPTLRSRLFRKYMTALALAVGIALLASGLVEVWTSYRDHTAWLVRIQRGQADAAAGKIGQFIEQIEAQIAWTIQFSWSEESPEEQLADALRLLHLVPAITELARVDPAGHEQLHVSRLTATVLKSGIDVSRDPKFIKAAANDVYRGSVYFREGTEPYMTLAIGNPVAGVTIAEINLGYIWDVVAGIKVGKQGAAYVVDANGTLIAHPDLALVLRNTDLSALAQVRAARIPGRSEELPYRAEDMAGRQVLTASAPIPRLGWLVFAELPIAEAYAPLLASLRIKSALLLAGLGLAMLLSLVLARRMVNPIRILQMGAARIGTGKLDHRIQITTGDELEAVGDQFNGMAARLQESYATLEGKVIERTRQLELANLAKTRFLAAASHDLRQPLHALGLLVAQLDGNVIRSERRRIVKRVGEAISAMNELFDALLDISKLDAGAVAPDVTAFPLDPVLHKIENMFATLARDKGLRLRVPPAGGWAQSDPILLERILLNLVSNAVRYTERGGILVGCRRRGETWRIEVWDSGIGIPKNQQQNIFGEFYQIADAGAEREGLGLGLAIVARLCRLLGHSLDLESVPGRGSRFSIAVPAAAAQIGAAEAPDPLRVASQSFTGKLVLVIDDDALVLDSMGGLLRSWGCQVSTWTSPATVLAELFDLHRKPDFIISDCHIARGNTGIQLVERLRRSFRAPIPALLITGDTSPERKLEAKAAGFELLQKPVPPMVLRATLDAMSRSGQAAQPQRTSDAELLQEPAGG
jgi:signal transduction histidine kinase